MGPREAASGSALTACAALFAAGLCHVAFPKASAFLCSVWVGVEGSTISGVEGSVRREGRFVSDLPGTPALGLGTIPSAQ